MSYSVGFIGYGLIARPHANALARLPTFFPDAPATERAIVAGRDEERLAASAGRLGFAETTTDWREVVDSVDVLFDLGPNGLHAEPCIRALENGVHVLCEKPLADTLADAERMTAAARASDAVAVPGFNYRYVPALVLAKELIESGALGDVYHLRGQYLQDWQVDPDAPWQWRNDADLAGYGRVGDVGSHTIDLARWLVGDIDSVMGDLRTFIEERPVEGTDETRPVTTDDAYAALAAFEDGAQGVFEASRVATGHKGTNAVEVIGSDGAVRFDMERLNELEVLRPDGRGYERVLVTDPGDPYIDAWWPPDHIIGWEHTFVHQTYEFLREIDSGAGSVPAFEDGLAVQRVVEAIVDSDDAGRRVAL